MTRADLLLHPMRLRILRVFLGDRALTTSVLHQELPDIPPASLYRHLARLLDAGVLQVVDERTGRGKPERTYKLRVEAATLGDDDLTEMMPQDHRAAFVAFVAGLLGDFNRLTERADFDPVEDRIGYALAGLWLTDTEYDELVGELDAALHARLANRPTGQRRRRVFGSIRLPADEP